MSELKWPVPALEVRLQDPDPAIRAWAARWLQDYHGHAGDESLRRFAESRQQVAAGATGAELAPQARDRAVLLDAGGSVSAPGVPPGPGAPPDVRALLTRLLAESHGVLPSEVLTFCPPVSLLPAVLAAIRKDVEPTGGWDALADLIVLVAGAGSELVRMSEVAARKRAIEPSFAEVGPVIQAHLVERRGTLAELIASVSPFWPSGGIDELPRQSASAASRVRAQLAWRVSAARVFAEEVARWPFGEAGPTSGACLVLALLLSARRAGELSLRAVDGATASAIVDLAAEEYPWLDDAIFEWAAKEWKGGSLAGEAIARLRTTEGPVRRSNLLHLFAETKDASSAAALVGELAKGGTEGLDRAAVRALAAVLPEGFAALRASLDTAPPGLVYVALQLVLHSPTAEAEGFLLENWDRILARFPAWAPLCMAAELFASPRFLPKLVELWRPGEERIEASIAFLGRWTPDPAPPVRRIAELFRARVEREERGDGAGDRAKDLEAFVRKHPLVPLTCAACGATFAYDVGLCFLQPIRGTREGEVRVELRGFQHVVQCKRCLARDDYVVPDDAQLLLRCRQQLGVLLLNKGVPPEQALERAMCVFDTPRMSDGTEVGSTMDAVRLLLGQVRSNPSDAGAWVRLGNLYRHGGLYGEAREAFETALSVEPGRIDALFSLANLDHGEHRASRAAERFHEVLRKLPSTHLPPAVGMTLFDGCVSGILDIEKKEGIPSRLELGVAAWELKGAAAREKAYCRLVGAPPPPRETERHADHAPKEAAQTITGTRTIGRNDPCPCGSGRKYKKCCGKE